MPSPFALLKCVGKVVLKAALNAIPLGGFVVEIASEAFQEWGKQADEQKRRKEVEALAQAGPAEVRAQVAEVVEEIAAGQPETVRQSVTAYLSQMPDAIRQSQRSPQDPTGRTVSPFLPLFGPEDLIPLLPTKLPRFKAGDRPSGIGDWELEGLLGTGGFGEVWKARNPYRPNAEPVALKFCLDAQAAKSLRHEAAMLDRVMTQGKHPDIVQLQHTFLSADPPCLQYEYIAGGDLIGQIQEWRSKGGLSPKQVARVVLRLAEIVGYAHRVNPPIVHRDLKPANILVQKKDKGIVLKVADFGIGGIAASQAIAESRGDFTRALMGATFARGCYSPFYASPQQKRGGPPDPRDDVYSLGVIWYQLLTNNLTTEKPGGGKWKLKLVEQGLAPMADLLESCFEDDPNDRPANAAVLADRLRSLLTKAATVAVASSQNPAVYGQAVTFTATVQAVPPATGLPTGTVTFRDGAAVLGSGALSNGTATLTTSALSAGEHGVTVAYGGDAQFPAVTSAPLSQRVSPAPPSVPEVNTTPTTKPAGPEFNWTADRLNVARALRTLGADEANPMTAAVIAPRCGAAAANAHHRGEISPAQYIKHHCYKDGPLVQFGFVGIAPPEEGSKHLRYFLTTAGRRALAAAEAEGKAALPGTGPVQDKSAPNISRGELKAKLLAALTDKPQTVAAIKRAAGVKSGYACLQKLAEQGRAVRSDDGRYMLVAGDRGETGQADASSLEDGLRARQKRILAALAKAGKPPTGAELAAEASVDHAGIGNLAGYTEPEKNAHPSNAGNLLNRGFVKVEARNIEGRDLRTYAITDAGKQALTGTPPSPTSPKAVAPAKTFNALLREAGIAPSDVRLIRHTDKRATKGRRPYELWFNNRPQFELYQSSQGFKNRQKLTVPYWAVFLGTPKGETLFVGIYGVKYRGLLEKAQPMPHIEGAVDEAGSCDVFDLTLQKGLSEFIGKLFIDWGQGALAWVQRADRQDKPITNITQKGATP